jgi:hypothetical protein
MSPRADMVPRKGLRGVPDEGTGENGEVAATRRTSRIEEEKIRQ